ncbi:hypothetical protein CcaverHIS002_0603110 [Cutaneotrichosporon cavernicola]|uniref:Extracellular membrane protein CFEM domain-containing protein n=1 Tax=Cutaneotrichosporon cavernicola TaxID=279322 RepID=A0AA48L878_9TREE|nr:uncharacterized protein CcaverHIS019_0602580 [Cutaneotrichosporon cavernicola]BEI86024.1 hypothetical protein CcaverHIS002_0603110 [Cutaneotrichosporon cavernicola]BEI93799.1 hypothetical protein CcaverHIS019_0602580 [Cutaneotrichosporon cavernicola]BEJ01576.1 hypothetical protein CcaverHIS631_0602580 [Cutaneotrichosporon cavernicola]BEJ09342.1 hypothetical protein CcaverHIS641_0602570 [Cutaneotrichosporon cavernicola]
MLAITLAATLFALANAQSAPDWKIIPKACATQCAKTIESSFLCENQYTGGTAIYSCFCESYPTDAADCATCLGSNNAAALGALLTSTQTDCAAQRKSCAFACAFDTCDSADVACQCDAGYLANIFNCASCNTANANGGTSLTDFEALKNSCAAQNFTGAAQDFSTFVQAPTGAAGYQAPVLTATGGGDAATGSFQPATDKAAATAAQGAGASEASGSAGASGSASAGASGAKPSASAASGSGAHSSGSSAAASAAASKPAGSGAIAVVAPAALVGLVAGVATLF